MFAGEQWYVLGDPAIKLPCLLRDPIVPILWAVRPLAMPLYAGKPQSKNILFAGIPYGDKHVCWETHVNASVCWESTAMPPCLL
jgi:hypothetical protein